MRIICPNCLAEYEVHASAVPAPGRDVQCSNCGHGWFQPALAVADDTSHKTVDARGAAPTGDTPPEQPASDTPQDDPAIIPGTPDTAPPTSEDAHETDDDAPDPPDDGSTRPARRIDEAVLNVLREEAEREARARRAEALEMDSQADLGLDAAGPHDGSRPKRPVRPEDHPTTPRPPRRTPGQSRARVSVVPAGTGRDDSGPDRPAPAEAETPPAKDENNTRGPAPVPTGPESVSDPEARRMRLPDIEEVTGTLRQTETSASQNSGGEAATGKGGSGFRLGFLVVLLIAAMALVLYALTPQIVATVPAAEPALAAFASSVDAARLWLALRLEAVMQAVLARLT